MKEQFLRKWSSWWILTKNKDELDKAFEKELNAVIKEENEKTTFLLNSDDIGLGGINITACCRIGPITNEKYCPNCGSKIVKE